MRKIIFCSIAVFFFACQNESPRQISPAFYHWKTAFQLADNERLLLDSLGVKKLYVKFFDVDWDAASGLPVPLASVEIDTQQLAGLDIVPTIFITNRTFLNLPIEDVEALSGRIFEKIKDLAPNGFQEIQFDCDWTIQTREKYFHFLEIFRTSAAAAPSIINYQSSIKISATIRLHQLKFPEKTGIPPMDRGMLMCYNMGDLDDWDTENSILDIDIAKQYISSKTEYALPLDVALPLFHWGVLYRDGRMIKLFNNLEAADLQDVARFEKKRNHRFEVKKNTFLQGVYLYEGDLFRLEKVGQAQLEAAADLLKNVAARPGLTVAFYHLDPATVKGFSAERLGAVLGRF